MNVPETRRLMTNEENNQQSVSDELKEVITAKFNSLVGQHGEFDKTYIDGMAKALAIECGIAGAKWQKKQDEKYINNLTWEAHSEGWNDYRMQLLEDAIDGYIAETEPGKFMAKSDYVSGFKRGEKVKLIIIKED